MLKRRRRQLGASCSDDDAVALNRHYAVPGNEKNIFKRSPYNLCQPHAEPSSAPSSYPSLSTTNTVMNPPTFETQVPSTMAPTTPPTCTVDSNGNYGRITTDANEQTVVSYFYQVYIVTGIDMLFLVQNIIPALELRLSNLLLPDLFQSVCFKVRRRHGRISQSTTMLGLMTTPIDQDLDTGCSGTSLTSVDKSKVDCYLVQGALTLVVGSGDAIASQRWSLFTWNAIRRMMQRGYLNATSTHPDLMGVEFLVNQEVDLSATTSNKINSNAPSPQTASPWKIVPPQPTAQSLPSMLNSSAATTPTMSTTPLSPPIGLKAGLTVLIVFLVLGSATGLYLLRRRYQQQRKVDDASSYCSDVRQEQGNSKEVDKRKEVV